MKLFLAGAECLLPKFERQVKSLPYLLFSFYNIHGRQAMCCAKLLKTCSIGILDSGAYSLLYGGGKDKQINFNAYLSAYIKFVKTHRIRHYCELDLDGRYDLTTINAVRVETEKHVGWPSMPCWHVERGEEELLKLSYEYDYIAIGGLVKSRRKQVLAMAERLLIKQKKRPKIHLMGVNQVKYFNSIFYSCDCSQPVNFKCLRFACGSSDYLITQKSFGKLRSIEQYLKMVRYYDDSHYLTGEG